MVAHVWTMYNKPQVHGVPFIRAGFERHSTSKLVSHCEGLAMKGVSTKVYRHLHVIECVDHLIKNKGAREDATVKRVDEWHTSLFQGAWCDFGDACVVVGKRKRSGGIHNVSNNRVHVSKRQSNGGKMKSLEHVLDAYPTRVVANDYSECFVCFLDITFSFLFKCKCIHHSTCPLHKELFFTKP